MMRMKGFGVLYVKNVQKKASSPARAAYVKIVDGLAQNRYTCACTAYSDGLIPSDFLNILLK